MTRAEIRDGNLMVVIKQDSVGFNVSLFIYEPWTFLNSKRAATLANARRMAAKMVAR